MAYWITPLSQDLRRGTFTSNFIKTKIFSIKARSGLLHLSTVPLFQFPILWESLLEPSSLLVPSCSLLMPSSSTSGTKGSMNYFWRCKKMHLLVLMSPSQQSTKEHQASRRDSQGCPSKSSDNPISSKNKYCTFSSMGAPHM